MPSYPVLEREAAWYDEYTTAAMKEFTRTMTVAFAGTQVWTKGDNSPGHMRGAHRSRRWIKTSQHCTNRTYTVTAPDDLLGDQNAIAGADWAAPRAVLIPACQRLDAAVRAGQFEEISEWYGNLGGDHVVDGWDNVRDRPASSDPSHLDHLHITVKRRYTNDFGLWRRIATVLIGVEDMTPEQSANLAQACGRLLAMTQGTDTVEWADAPKRGEPVWIVKEVKRIAAIVDRLAAGGVDPGALAAELAPLLPAAATEEQVRDAVADLAEGGAAAVRADAQEAR
jgi:hypothetical protein